VDNHFGTEGVKNSMLCNASLTVVARKPEALDSSILLWLTKLPKSNEFQNSSSTLQESKQEQFKVIEHRNLTKIERRLYRRHGRTTLYPRVIAARILRIGVGSEVGVAANPLALARTCRRRHRGQAQEENKKTLWSRERRRDCSIRIRSLCRRRDRHRQIQFAILTQTRNPNIRATKEESREWNILLTTVSPL